MNRSILIQVLFVLLPALALTMGYSPAMGQIKYEQERRIQEKEVPEKAKQFLDSCGIGSSVKWYRETSEDGITVEAKTRHRSNRYSIEFNKDGHIQDVEAIVKQADLPDTAAKNMDAYLSGVFKRYRIEKIQSQWLGSDRTLQQLIRGIQTDQPFTLNYEVVVKGKKDKEEQLYEILFDHTGRQLKTSTIVPRNTDHLDF